jgi:DNA-binding NtrC family response regulator
MAVTSAALTTADEDVRLAGAVGVSVLITAERSIERERCAHLIHDGAGVGRGPFVRFSAGSADPRPSTSSRDDLVLPRSFEQARGGTLFVDHVDALTTAQQAQLLSLLEKRVPGAGSMMQSGSPAPVRVITGAGPHLATKRTTGAFSELLFYRLNVIHVDLLSPPPRTSG